MIRKDEFIFQPNEFIKRVKNGVATKGTTMQNRLDNEALLILGMSRSGTSATAGALHILGVHLSSNLKAPDRSNPRGYFEPDFMPNLDRKMMEVFGRSWSDPRQLPSGWEHDPRFLPFKEQIRNHLLEEFFGKPFWGLKYPNLSRLLPIWLPLLNELGVKIKILIVARKPTEVAASLQVYNHLPLELSMALWLGHIVPAILETVAMKRSIILYEDLMENGPAEIERIASELELPISLVDDEKRKAITKFLSRDLRHHHEPVPERTQGPWLGWANEAYGEMGHWRHEKKVNQKIFEDIFDAMREVEEKSTPYTQYIDHVKSNAEQVLSEYLSSYSMRITKPLRLMKKGLLSLKKNPQKKKT